MPDRSHAKWRPAYLAGNIGTRKGDPKLIHVPKPYTRGTAIGDGMYAENRGRPYMTANEHTERQEGMASRFCNPPGFFGLHGNMAGENQWLKQGGVREVKQRTEEPDGSLRSLKGHPFKSRGSK